MADSDYGECELCDTKTWTICCECYQIRACDEHYDEYMVECYKCSRDSCMSCAEIHRGEWFCDDCYRFYCADDAEGWEFES